MAVRIRSTIDHWPAPTSPGLGTDDPDGRGRAGRNQQDPSGDDRSRSSLIYRRPLRRSGIQLGTRNRLLDHVRQRGLDHLPRVVDLLGPPVPNDERNPCGIAAMWSRYSSRYFFG